MKDRKEKLALSRRQFIKYGLGGMAALFVGDKIPSILENNAYALAPVQELDFTITDGIKDMATHNVINPAQCYFWLYKEATLAAEVPGPHIFTLEGTIINITITNSLDEPHAFFIPGLFDSGPIAPGQTVVKRFGARTAGTHLYYDNLNDPVNRVMGLHGAFIVMPKAPKRGHKFTPYSTPTPGVQAMFDDFGTATWWPGLAWEQGATNPGARATPPFRQYIWLLHQASPVLFQAVGSLPAGQIMPSAEFVQKFLHDAFVPTRETNNVPCYFTITGQSGHFSHNTPYICPNLRVGEPCVIRILNAGLWSHSMHIHANHVFITSINGVVQENPIWVDVFTVDPMDVVEYVTPYMRPPDVPNVRGIGRADAPLPTNTGGTAWPPLEELAMFIPAAPPALAAQLSPLCYPMHDHSEPTQTSQGGNYNMGMISGINFIGDRSIAGLGSSFPNQPLIDPPGPGPGIFLPTVPPPWFG